MPSRTTVLCFAGFLAARAAEGVTTLLKRTRLSDPPKVATSGVYNPHWPRPKGLTFQEACERGLMVIQDGPSAWESGAHDQGMQNPGNLVWSLGARTLLGNSSTLSMNQSEWHDDNSLSGLLIATGPLIGDYTPQVGRIINYIDDLISKVTLPTVILGVGVFYFPGALNFDCPDTLDAHTIQLLDNIQARINTNGGFVGLRGKCTEQVIRKYGYVGFETLGCPSLFINTMPNLGMKLQDKFQQLMTQLDSHDPSYLHSNLQIAVNMPDGNDARIVPLLTNILLAFPKSIIVSQEDNGGDIFQKACDELGIERPERQKVAFYDVDDWRQKMSQMDLVVTARIHGGMISIAAETPTIVIPPDTRVQELVDAMLIPHVRPQSQGLPGSLIELVRTASASFDGRAFDEQRSKFAKRYKELFDNAGFLPNPELARI